MYRIFRKIAGKVRISRVSWLFACRRMTGLLSPSLIQLDTFYVTCSDLWMWVEVTCVTTSHKVQGLTWFTPVFFSLWHGWFPTFEIVLFHQPGLWMPSMLTNEITDVLLLHHDPSYPDRGNCDEGGKDNPSPKRRSLVRERTNKIKSWNCPWMAFRPSYQSRSPENYH